MTPIQLQGWALVSAHFLCPWRGLQRRPETQLGGSGADPAPTVLGHLTLLSWAPLKIRGRQGPHGAGGQMLSFSLGHS